MKTLLNHKMLYAVLAVALGALILYVVANKIMKRPSILPVADQYDTMQTSVLPATDRRLDEQAALNKKIEAIELKLAQMPQLAGVEKSGVGEQAALNKKIEAIESKLTHTQHRLDVAENRIDTTSEQVRYVADTQQQVCESAKEIRKSYVKERVRREIADEVIKNHLGAE